MNTNNITKAKEFIEKEALEYKLAEYDEGGFSGIDEHLLEQKLEEYHQSQSIQMKERIKELEKQANKLIQWETDYPPQRIYGMSQTITIAKELEEIILSFKNALNSKT